jgi:hypothetical protein
MLGTIEIQIAFQLAKIRKDLVPTPPIRAERCPSVIVGRKSA